MIFLKNKFTYLNSIIFIVYYNLLFKHRKMDSIEQILNKIQLIEKEIEDYDECHERYQIERRFLLKQNKKDIKNLKYQIYLIKKESFDQELINEMKDKIIFLYDCKVKIINCFHSRHINYNETCNSLCVQIENLNQMLEQNTEILKNS